MIKISVIVPAYNVEKVIDNCLRSLMHQTLADAEYVVINDGSQDHTEQVIQKYVEQDKRFRLHTQENQGVGAARNAGIELSTGKYIAFVDADDCLLQDNALEVLFHNAEKENADIVAFGNVTSSLNNDYQKHYPISNRVLILKKECVYDGVGYTLFNPDYRPSVWNKLYKRDVIEGIRFESYDKVISEDTLFNLEAFISGTRFLLLDEELYGYHIIQDSLSHQKEYIDVEKRICNSIGCIERSTVDLHDELKAVVSSYYYIELLGTEMALLKLFNKVSASESKASVLRTLRIIGQNCEQYRWDKGFTFKAVLANKKKALYYDLILKLIQKKSYGMVANVLSIKTAIAGKP